MCYGSLCAAAGAARSRAVSGIANGGSRILGNRMDSALSCYPRGNFEAILRGLKAAKLGARGCRILVSLCPCAPQKASRMSDPFERNFELELALENGKAVSLARTCSLDIIFLHRIDAHLISEFF